MAPLSSILPSMLLIAARLSVVVQSSTKQVSYDYLMYACHWPPAQCLVANEHAAGSCVYEARSAADWPLHGLWPSTFDGHMGPAYCKGKPYDPAAIAQLRPELLVQWPNLLPHTSTDSFWSHEWSKHGRCAIANTSSAPVSLRGRDERAYFGVALQLLHKLDVKRKLAAAGFAQREDTGYHMSQIEAAVASAFGGHRGRYECVKESARNRWHLSSLRLCLDKGLTVIDCQPQRHDYVDSTVRSGVHMGSNGLPHNEPCPNNTMIYYIPPKQ